MKKETMFKALELHRKIEACKELQSSFFWEPFTDGVPPQTRHPKLMI